MCRNDAHARHLNKCCNIVQTKRRLTWLHLQVLGHCLGPVILLCAFLPVASGRNKHIVTSHTKHKEYRVIQLGISLTITPRRNFLRKVRLCTSLTTKQILCQRVPVACNSPCLFQIPQYHWMYNYPSRFTQFIQDVIIGEFHASMASIHISTCPWCLVWRISHNNVRQ